MAHVRHKAFKTNTPLSSGDTKVTMHDFNPCRGKAGLYLCIFVYFPYYSNIGDKIISCHISVADD